MEKNCNKTKLLSVCIPTYDMDGFGHIFLKHSFDILTKQTFANFNVIITDNSENDSIKKACEDYKNKLDIKYYKNKNNIGMTRNVNRTIKKATGKLIKILFQDDFLYNEKSLENIIKNFDLKKDKWLITACEHSKDGINFYRPFYPKYNNKIYLGKNTISSPSVLTIKNERPLLFDENLIWLMDCDYYKRCYDKFGKPKIVNKISAVIRTGAHQTTNTTATKSLRKNEFKYITKKYKKSTKIQLKNITLVAVTGINAESAIEALELSMLGIDYFDVVLISHKKPKNINKKITFKQCEPDDLKSKDPKNTNDYSKFIAYKLHKYIDSDFVLIVHKNAYVIRPNKWIDEFLKYDYVGAPWPKNIHFTKDGTNIRVGNGGFSLRSKKLLKVLNNLNLPFTDNGTGFYHEDGIICVYYRKKLEKYGIKFAPVEIASKFSREIDCADSYPAPFGFHDNKKVIPKIFLIKKMISKYLKI